MLDDNMLVHMKIKARNHKSFEKKALLKEGKQREKGPSASNRRKRCYLVTLERPERCQWSPPRKKDQTRKSIYASHTFLNSFGRAAKSKLWPIRHRGREVNSNPYLHNIAAKFPNLLPSTISVDRQVSQSIGTGKRYRQIFSLV